MQSNVYLLFRTNPNNIHSLPGFKILFRFIQAFKLDAVRLIKVVKRFGISEFVSLTLLTDAQYDYWVHIYCKHVILEKCMDRQGAAPQEGQHIACRNNGNFSLDQIFDRHGISQGDKFLRQLLIFSHSDQTGSQQIYRND